MEAGPLSFRCMKSPVDRIADQYSSLVSIFLRCNFPAVSSHHGAIHERSSAVPGVMPGAAANEVLQFFLRPSRKGG